LRKLMDRLLWRWLSAICRVRPFENARAAVPVDREVVKDGKAGGRTGTGCTAAWLWSWFRVSNSGTNTHLSVMSDSCCSHGCAPPPASQSPRYRRVL